MLPASNPVQRSMKIRDLCDEETGIWNMEILMELFGLQTCMQIIAKVRLPRDEAGEDTLIFTKSTNGMFSIKKAYNHIRQVEVETGGSSGAISTASSRVWEIIWHKGRVLLRIRIFLWKALQNALPLAMILTSRLSRGDPTCQVCSIGDEDVKHMLFLCPFARACWFNSPLALRTENLAIGIGETIEMLAQTLSDEDWIYFTNAVWAIWRCRNERTYGGQMPSIEMFTKFFVVVERESRIATTANRGPSALPSVTRPQQDPETDSVICHVDGSWREPWQGGFGFIIEKGRELVAYRAAPTKASCLIQAEAIALKEAVLKFKGMGITNYYFFSDNQVLVQTCMALQPPVEVDWRAYREMYDIWLLLKETKYICHHVNKC